MAAPSAQPESVVINFNPWLVSGSEQLVSQFFTELAEALPRQLGPTRGSQAAQRLRRYAKGLRTLERAPGIGWVFQMGGALMDEAGGRIDEEPTSLHEERRMTQASLAELDVRIVVLVDDVDRLQPIEIQHLMRMIKMVGDFSNVVYLLAFDRGPVRAALTGDGVDGSEYLEKIVQVEYPLPEPPPEKLEALLGDELNAVLNLAPQEPFDQPRWASIYRRIIRPLVTRPRHVRRFTNALPLALELAGDEVAVVDVVALTAIQTFLPELHDALPRLRDDLTTRGVSRLYGEDARRDETAQRLRQAAGDSSNNEVALAAFELLFPLSDAALKNTYYAEEDERLWRRERRVASRDALDTYITASLPAGALAVADIRSMIASFADPDELDRLLSERPIEDLPAFVTTIWDHLDEIELDRAEAAIPVLQAHEQRLSEASQDPLSPAARIRALVLALVRRFESEEERDRVVRCRFDEQPSLSRRFTWLRDASYRDDSLGKPLISAALLAELRASLVTSVLEADVETLRREHRVGLLLANAWETGGTDVPDQVLDLVIEAGFVSSFVATFLRMGGGAHRYVLPISDLKAKFGEDWLRRAALRAAAESLPADQLEREALAQLLEHYRDQLATYLDQSEDPSGSAS